MIFANLIFSMCLPHVCVMELGLLPNMCNHPALAGTSAGIGWNGLKSYASCEIYYSFIVGVV